MNPDNDKELREQFSLILDLPRTTVPYSDKPKLLTWAQIFTEMGKLMERANKQPEVKWIYPNTEQMPLVGEPPSHDHNGFRCYKNPCIWA